MIENSSIAGLPVFHVPLPTQTRQEGGGGKVKEVTPTQDDQRGIQNDNQKPMAKADREKNTVPAEDMNLEEFKENVNLANNLMESLNRQINFTVDEETDRIVVKIVDGSTKEVIRQIPPEEMLDIMSRLQDIVDDFKGLLYNNKG